MIARELTEFFARLRADGAPRGLRPGRPDVPLERQRRYRRACWEEIRFDDVAYSEDQAFGRALAAHPRWRKVYHPGAAVLHAHDYPPVEFMRRYFDEYRGLRETIGHVEPFGVRSTVRDVRGARRRATGAGCASAARRAERARWTARSLVHHSGRKVFSALGSRAERAAAAPSSARCRSRGARTTGSRRRRAASAARPHASPAPSDAVLRGDRPRAARRAGAAARARTRDGRPRAAAPRVRHPAVQRRLRRPQHHLPARAAPRADGPHLLDLGPRPVRRPPARRRRRHAARDRASTSRRCRRRCSRGLRRLVRRRRRRWPPAGRPSTRCSSSTACRARAYLVNDHEPEFYATSVESRLGGARPTASASTASPAARGCATLRRPLRRARRDVPVRRRPGRLLPAADRAPRRHRRLLRARRDAAARRAARRCSALAELRRRRPDVRIVAVRRPQPLDAPFAFEHVGIASPEELVVAVLGGDRRPLPLDDQLLADPAGDARLRPAVRRPRGRRARARCSAPTARSSWRPSTPTRSPTRSSACSTTRSEWERRSRPGSTSSATHTWDGPPSRSSASCATRCGCARPRRGAARARRPRSAPCSRSARCWPSRGPACCPAFQAPDEQSHFTYVQSLAERHALPGRRRPPVLLDPDDAGHRRGELRPGRRAARGQAGVERPGRARWRADEAPAPRDDGGGPGPATDYPPTAYAWQAIGYAAAAGGTLFDELLGARLMSALWVPLTVLARGCWRARCSAAGGCCRRPQRRCPRCCRCSRSSRRRSAPTG